MNNELFRRDVDCQRVGNPGSSDCSGDLLFRSLAAQKSSVFRKVLRAESGCVCVGGVCWLHWYFPAWNISIS